MKRVVAVRSFFLLFVFLIAFASHAAAGSSLKKIEEGDGVYRRARLRMVEEQLRERGIKDSKVLAAMSKVPRHLFVPRVYRALAYSDGPLPIGQGQTISQPYIVAFMTEALKLSATDRVLEVGTGSGYQAAVLAEIVAKVDTIEIIPELGRAAGKRLKQMGYTNIAVRIGDGYLGWLEEAPFDAIMVTAAPEKVPQALIDQLKEGGRLCLPVGSSWSLQTLILFTKEEGNLKKEELLPVRFVPMIHAE